jgi:hypothetical protein
VGETRNPGNYQPQNAPHSATLQVTTDRDIPGSEAEEMSPLFKTCVQPDAIIAMFLSRVAASSSMRQRSG